MTQNVVPLKTEAEQYALGERLAGQAITLAFIRRHYGEIAYKAAKRLRRDQKEQPSWPKA